ncbi:MAG TPA: hypothetical protein VFI29_11065 [Hanamia sp.]|nr:hypothetical protein [Hanamia sp.]
MEDFNMIIKYPVSAKNAKIILSKEEIRDDFLMYYKYFTKDGNKKVYQEWIKENIESKNNIMLEHIFELSNYIQFFSKNLLSTTEIILCGRFKSSTKIACLDYLQAIRQRITKAQFIMLNKIAIKHSESIIIKFQSYLNLSIYLSENLLKIQSILKKEKFPTLFYRLINQIELLPVHIREELSTFLIKELKKKRFNQDVKNEIKKDLKLLRDRGFKR